MTGNRKTRVSVDTVEITPASVKGWKRPPFQREFRMNAKVVALVADLKSNDGVLPGVITLAKMGPLTYLLDGQHRIAAFVESGVSVGYCDVRIAEFEDMAEMGREFVQLNSQIVRLRPDDILRGMEASNIALKKLRTSCPFVGFEQVRRGPSSPLLSMSAVLRCWHLASKECPFGGALPVMDLATETTREQSEALVSFLTDCFEAWGPDGEYARLWGALNLTICCWLYQRIVLASYSTKTVRLTRPQFVKCMQALSASPKYLEWLRGRLLTETDRSPAYRRIASLMVARHTEIAGKPLRMPQPEWVKSGGSTARRMSQVT